MTARVGTTRWSQWSVSTAGGSGKRFIPSQDGHIGNVVWFPKGDLWLTPIVAAKWALSVIKIVGVSDMSARPLAAAGVQAIPAFAGWSRYLLDSLSSSD